MCPASWPSTVRSSTLVEQVERARVDDDHRLAGADRGRVGDRELRQVEVVALGQVQPRAGARRGRPTPPAAGRSPSRTDAGEELLAQRALVAELDQLAHDHVEHRDGLQRGGGRPVGRVLVGLRGEILRGAGPRAVAVRHRSDVNGPRSLQADHEPQPAPRLVDRADLVVDEPVGSASSRTTSSVRSVAHAGGPLGPGDPQPGGGLHQRPQPGQPPLELRARACGRRRSRRPCPRRAAPDADAVGQLASVPPRSRRARRAAARDARLDAELLSAAACRSSRRSCRHRSGRTRAGGPAALPRRPGHGPRKDAVRQTVRSWTSAVFQPIVRPARRPSSATRRWRGGPRRHGARRRRPVRAPRAREDRVDGARPRLPAGRAPRRARRTGSPRRSRCSSTPSRRTLEDTCRTAADAGSRCVVEVTERALIARPEALLRALTRLRTRGWGIALDDVGADSRSLALMSLLYPDVIKLDLRLLRDRSRRDVARIVTAVGAEAERRARPCWPRGSTPTSSSRPRARAARRSARATCSARPARCPPAAARRAARCGCPARAATRGARRRSTA